MPEFGQVLGKGDAMWRALSVARGELVVYLDSDTRDFSPHFALGMLGPLICEPDVRFVKGFFHRPYRRADGAEQPADGGRVTELTARPLLSAFFPELAAFVQPLAGEVAARRTLFEQIPFATGYAVETAMLLHARDLLGGTDRHGPGGPRRPAAAATSRSASSARWRTPCSSVILERLRADGRLWTATRLRSRRPTAGSSRSRSWSGRRTPSSAPARSGDQVRLHRPRRHAARRGRVAVPHRWR